MIAKIVEDMANFKGTYPEKVKSYMKVRRNLMTQPPSGFKEEMEEDPVFRYDYDSYCLKKRIEGTVSGISEAKKRLSDVFSPSQTEAMFAFTNSLIMKGGYNHEIDRFNTIALSSAVWILDELLLAGNIEEIYQYLPAVNRDDCEETFCLPIKHPIYEDDLIFSLVYLIRHRNSSKTIGDIHTGALVFGHSKPESDEESLKNRAAFDSILALLNPNSVQEATERFKEKVWEFYRIAFSVKAAVDKKEKDLIKQRDDIQNYINDSIAKNIKPTNVLLMPSAVGNDKKSPILGGQEFDRRRIEIRGLEKEIDRLEGITFTCVSLPNDREKLVNSLKGIIPAELADDLISFHVDDPFESAFALLYLLDTDSIIPWYYFGSVSVGYTLCDQLPYDVSPEIPQKPVKLTGWNSALYQHRFKGYRFDNRTDASGEPVEREYGKNLSQLVLSNTLSLIPRVVPEQGDLTTYFNHFGELSEHEKEAYSLLSYALVAGQLRTKSLHEYHAIKGIMQYLEDSQQESSPQSNVDEEQLRSENDRLRAKNKELVKMLSEILADQKTDSKQVLLLQHQIEMQEKELADLREAVFVLEDETTNEESIDETIRYPYLTTGKILSFGGHVSWLKEIRKKLPNVMFVAPDALPNTDLIRKADTVWLQTNCLSHADFFRIINIVRQNGIQLRYFSFASSQKCAEQLVKSL